MSRPEDHGLGATALAELESIDAALAGLALALRDTREPPDEEVARALDTRAAEHFMGPRRRRMRSRLHDVVNHPAFAVAAILLAVVVLVLPLALFAHGSGGAKSAASPSGVVQSALPSRAAGGKTPPLPAPSAPSRPPSAGGAGATARHAPALGAAPAPATRQIEHTASLDVGVAPSSMQSTSQRVFTIASAFRGHVEQSNVSSGNAEQSGATFTISVPSTNLSGAIAALAHLGHVRSENETTNDVTEAHAGLARSLADARAEHASLIKQLAQASETQSVEALKAKLREVEGTISRLEGQLHALDTRVQFTNIALSLTSEAAAGGATAGDLTPGGALHDAGAILDAGLAVLVLAAAALIPVGAIIAACAFGLAALRRRMRESALDAG